VLNSVVFYWRNKILRKEAMRILRTLYWIYLKRRTDYIME
jgi:hypothetical protein